MKDDVRLMSLLNRRYACKKFKKDQSVKDEELLQILKAGRLAPSSFGMEPWKMLVVDNDKIKSELYPYAWGFHNSFNGNTRLVIILNRINMNYDDPYVMHIMKDVQGLDQDMIKPRLDRFKKFQSEDFNLLDNNRYLSDWTGKQSYIALAFMMMMAAALDIDSCPIEGFNKEKVIEVLVSNKLIDTDHYTVSVMVSFGHKDEDIRPKKRQLISSVVDWIR